MPMDPKTNTKHIRYAPSFVAGVLVAGNEHPFTEDSLAKFLGMTSKGQPQEKFSAALGALELIEQGYLKENQLDDWPAPISQRRPAVCANVEGGPAEPALMRHEGFPH
jgi:hypothetical protein